MNESSDPSTPKLSASRDDRPGSDGRRGAPKEPRRRGGRASGPVLTEHDGRRGGAPWLLVLLLVAAGGAYAWWSEHRQAQTDARLQAEVLAAREAAQRELEQLRGSLSATGETLSEAEAQTGGRLETIDSEIRKLWDVSNKRNKTWIKENEAALEEAGKARGELAKRLSDLESWRQEQRKLAEAQDSKLTALDRALAALRKENTRLRAQADEQSLAMQTRVDQVSAQLGQVNSGLRKLEQQLQQVQATASSNADSVESINAFRRQTMQSLTTLQSAVSNLQREVERMRQPY